MNGVGNCPALQSFERHAEVFAGLATGEFELAGRRYKSGEGRNVVTYQAKMMFTHRGLKPPGRSQGLVGPPLVLDIGAHSAPFHEHSGCVGQRTSTEHEPAVLSVEPPQA